MRSLGHDPTRTYYAHSLEGRPESEWEPLEEHLQRVAALAEEFAGMFGAGPWGRLAGLWHDLGKYRPEFQERLRGSGASVEHAGLGAALAVEKGRTSLPLAFAVAGHHAGLANRDAQGKSDLRPLTDRLGDNEPVLATVRTGIPTHLLAPDLPPLPAVLEPTSESAETLARRWEFWTRFLFSSLIDADRLATEAFYDAEKGSSRGGRFSSLAELRRHLDDHLDGLPVDTDVNIERAAVLRDCRAAAEREVGCFSLTAPTGAGKTLSAMAFALAHAERHGLRRVIVVVPYTTIIEQNAGVYRRMFGSVNVIEHHSNVDEDAREQADRETEIRRRLATENWDAPIIVTTTVQFFESLFSNHPSRCRKLHNIANSVIVLDEAQALPAAYLDCLLDGLQSLVDWYGCSIVVSTATLPALGRREALPGGLTNVREIVADPAGLGQRLNRVTVHWPHADSEPLSYETLAKELVRHRQVLAVVHLRADAQELAELLPATGRYHLSALMCAAHRADVLAQVKAALLGGETCRLVATQLVEAGVDVDFPVVYRAMAGLDSLAQAAGRCNREGKTARGHFHVFLAPTRPPAGVLRKGLEITEALRRRHGADLDFSDPFAFEEYFRRLYHVSDLDRHAIQAERAALNFANVARGMRLVEDDYRVSVVVPWRDGERRLRDLEARPTRATLRAVQPFLVQVPQRTVQEHLRRGVIREVSDMLFAVAPEHHALYDDAFGLVIERDAAPDPAAFVI